MINIQTVLLVLGLLVVAAFVYLFTAEKFDSLLKADAGSSVDCGQFPESPACKPPECVVDSDCTTAPYTVCSSGKCTTPETTDLATCAPSDGKWSIADQGPQGRSQLNSPCCQPPDYKLATSYKTCSTISQESNPGIAKCLADCCNYVADQGRFYDPSWTGMAKCACSLWCYNQNVPHFAKYGTAQHYISGDLATAKTRDTDDYIHF